MLRVVDVGLDHFLDGARRFAQVAILGEINCPHAPATDPAYVLVTAVQHLAFVEGLGLGHFFLGAVSTRSPGRKLFACSHLSGIGGLFVGFFPSRWGGAPGAAAVRQVFRIVRDPSSMLLSYLLDVVASGSVSSNHRNIVARLSGAAAATKVFAGRYPGATFTTEGHFTITGGAKKARRSPYFKLDAFESDLMTRKRKKVLPTIISSPSFSGWRSPEASRCPRFTKVPFVEPKSSIK